MKEECLSKVVLIGERSLQRALNEYLEYFHAERNHQGKGNVLLCPRTARAPWNAASDWVGEISLINCSSPTGASTSKFLKRCSVIALSPFASPEHR